MLIEVWSDIACPWCYVGKRRLEKALSSFPQREQVKLTWRAFELNPHAKRSYDPSISYAERLAKKYGVPPARGQAMIDQMTQTAAAEGLEFRFDQIRPGNTFDAHRLVHLADARGLQDALKERFFKGYLCEGQPIGAHEALQTMAQEVGLDPQEVKNTLQGDAFGSAVRQEQALAQSRGVHGVPHFLIDGRHPIPGAQSPELLLSVISKTYESAQDSA